MKLQEFTSNRGAKLRVDREHGVIEGVKVLGLQSRNGREYARPAVEKALGLYEGKVVNLDHIRPGQERSYRDRIGRLVKPQLREDGLFADLLINPKHSIAEQLLWDAENAPENVGMSHDAEGTTVRRGDTDLVEEITRVTSVDLVSDPASTRGLFESETPSHKEIPMTKTIHEIVDAAPKGTKHLDGLRRLMEEETPMIAPETAVEVAPEADPNEEVRAALEKACLAVLRKLFAGEIEESEAFAKIKELLAVKEKATSDEEGATPAPEAETVESLRRQVKELHGREAARELLESEGVQPKLARVSALARCATEAERLQLLAEFPKDSGRHEEPRSTGALTEGRRSNGKRWVPPKDAAEFASRLTS